MGTQSGPATACVLRRQRGVFGYEPGKAILTYPHPYPTADEVPAVRAAFDNFFRVVETRTDDAVRVAMFSRSTQPLLQLAALARTE